MFQATEHAKNEQAQLITKPFRGNMKQVSEDVTEQISPPCRMSIWIYIYGQQVTGKLFIYQQYIS